MCDREMSAPQPRAMGSLAGAVHELDQKRESYEHQERLRKAFDRFRLMQEPLAKLGDPALIDKASDALRPLATEALQKI
jgi:hypothetical protein